MVDFSYMKQNKKTTLGNYVKNILEIFQITIFDICNIVKYNFKKQNGEICHVTNSSPSKDFSKGTINGRIVHIRRNPKYWEIIRLISLLSWQRLSLHLYFLIKCKIKKNVSIFIKRKYMLFEKNVYWDWEK